jgi:hypothetical protein
MLDFRQAAHQTFTECANVECLRNATTTCAPAPLAEGFSTLEGTDVVRDTFVVSMRGDSWDSQGCSQVVVRQVEPCQAAS